MLSAALVAGGWLAGCATDAPDKASAETKQQTAIPSPEEFTMVGKPTRTIDTPMGPREIYDPAQDPDIVEKFRNVSGKYYGGELPIIQMVRVPQLRQLTKFGCTSFKDDHGPFILDSGVICRDSNLGGYANRDECLLHTAGHYGNLEKPDTCKISVIATGPDYPDGKPFIFDRADPANNHLPMQNVCFAQKVRVQCTRWTNIQQPKE